MAEIASAFVSILPSAQGFSTKLGKEIGPGVKASGLKAGKEFGDSFGDGYSRDANGRLRDANGRYVKESEVAGKRSGLGFGKLFAIGASLALGAKAFSFLGDSLAEATDAAVVGSRTENVITKMGNAANISAGQVGKLAMAISNKTGIDDEAIQAGQNMLLTFGQVRNEVGKGNDIFNQTSKLMVDMSTAMGSDAKSAALQLGKALNDPTKGVTALARAGVSFTQQQKDQIASMQESGNMLGAQKIILGEVEKQFGGAAAAMSTPAERAKVAWGNLQEQFGTIILPMFNSVAAVISGRIVPAISAFIAGMQSGTGAGGRFAAVMTTAGSALGKVAGFIDNNRAAVGTFVGIIGTVIVVTKAWAAGQALLNIALTANPIGLVVVAIAALAGGLVFAYKRSETFRKIVDGAFKAVKASALVVANFFTKSVPAAFGKVQSSAASALGWVQGNWPKILAILTGPFGIAAALIIKNWDSIKAGGQRVVMFVATIPSKITGIFAGAATLLYNAGVQLMTGLASGITNKIEDAINAVRSGLSRLKGLLPGSPIKWGPLKNWNNGGAGKRLMDLVTLGITKGTPKTIEAAQTAFGKIGDALKSTRSDLQSTLDGLKSDFASLADSVAQAFTGDLFGVTATEAAAGVAGRTVGENFFANLIAKRADLTTMLSSFKTLQGWGLAPSFLSQLFASGNGALITELAGMGQSSAQVAGQLFTDVTNLGAQLGGAVASNDPVAAGIAEMTEELRIANRQLGYLSKDIGKELNGVAAKAQRDKKNKKGRK